MLSEKSLTKEYSTNHLYEVLEPKLIYGEKIRTVIRVLIWDELLEVKVTSVGI